MKPILFSTPMVRAILEGRKSQTRREVKYGKKITDPTVGFSIFTEKGEFEVRGVHENGEYGSSFFKVPIGKGDILWIKEQHYRYGRWIHKAGHFKKNSQPKWMFVPITEEVRYYDNAPADYRKGMHNSDPHWEGWYRRNSLFMPYESARIFLKVTGVRVEHLQEITEHDVLAEGAGL